MRYLSICSGIEAATVAWRPLGWTPVAFAEIEPFPCAVLAHHYGSNLPSEPLATNGVPNLGDITRFKAWPDLAIDVLVGGTPCQSFSVAGLRKGLADPRGNLALTYLAIADRYRPRWLLWENVPGVLSSGDGRDFGSFLGGLAELGYGFAYRVLDAQYVRVDGFGRAVPQRRRRVFVVGYLGDWRRAAAVLFDAASLCGDPAPRREARQRIADSLTVGANQYSGFCGEPVEVSPTISARPTGGGGLGTDFDCGGGLIPAWNLDLENLGDGGNVGWRTATDAIHTLNTSGNIGIAFDTTQIAFGGNRTSGPLDVATAVNAHGGPHGRLDFESETFVCAPPLTSNPYGYHESREGLLVTHSLRAEGFDASEDGTGRGPPSVPVAFSCKDHGADVGEIAPTLRSMGHDGSHANAGGQVAVAFHENQRGEVTESNTAGSLKTGGGKPGQGYPSAMIGAAVRRLLPIECERLQAFPDHYTAVPFRGRPASDGPRYKALGNSMAVNCIRWLGQRIKAVEAVGAA